jgi:hypothetical protein
MMSGPRGVALRGPTIQWRFVTRQWLVRVQRSHFFGVLSKIYPRSIMLGAWFGYAAFCSVSRSRSW